MTGVWYFVAISYLIGYLPNIIGFLVFTIFIFLSRRHLLKNRLLLFLTLTFFLLSTVTSPQPSPKTSLEVGTQTGIVKIISNPKVDEDQLQFKGQYRQHDILFYSEDQKSGIAHGAVCKITSDLKLPGNPTNPGEFNYRTYLFSQGISYVGFQTKVFECEGQSFLSYIFETRNNIMNHIEKKLSDETFKWVNALIFGNRNDIDERTIENFQFWGLSHLLAISGLHVGLFLSICYFILLKIIRLTKEQSKWILIVIIPLFIIIAGGQPPVIRAGLMSIGAIIWSFFNHAKHLNMIDLLSLILIGLLLIDPYLIFQLSFQFSFAVTAALILSKRLLKNNHWFMLSLKVSLICQLAILPLQLYYFYYTNVLSFLMNLIYVPYFTICLIPVLLIVIFSTFFLPSSVTAFFETFINEINHYMFNLLNVIGKPDLPIWVVGKPHLLIIISYYVCFIFFMYYWDRRFLHRAKNVSVLMVGVIYLQIISYYLNPNYQITMLDVGQAESIIIELPYRKGVYVVDVGEELNEQEHHNFNRIIKPYLWHKGISQIDAVFISHLDIDHSGSLNNLIKQFKPKRLYTSVYVKPIKNKSIKHIRLRDKMTIREESTTMTIFTPKVLKQTDSNDQSLIFNLQYKNHQMLFTGDISSEVERMIIPKLDQISVDILKVAHHGSKNSTSQSFLKKIKPDVALISVGKNNRYGHPDSTVLQRFKELGIKVFRTDQDGAIIFIYRNGQSTFYKYNP